MTLVPNRYESALKPLKVRFFIAAALLLIVGIACAAQLRNRLLLEKTSAELTRAQSGLVRVKAASANRRQVLTALQSQLGQGVQKSSPEMILYGKVDELKTHLNPDDMTITAVERKGGEASLQYTLTFGNADFNHLLNSVNYLQSAVFPLTPVNFIAVTQSESKGTTGVSFKVTGKVITSEKMKP